MTFLAANYISVCLQDNNDKGNSDNDNNGTEIDSTIILFKKQKSIKLFFGMFHLKSDRFKVKDSQVNHKLGWS